MLTEKPESGVLCCVGPAVLALFGVVGAGTAFVWATTLYDGYPWWFRLASLGLTALLVYAALYAVTTWLGPFAS